MKYMLFIMANHVESFLSHNCAWFVMWTFIFHLTSTFSEKTGWWRRQMSPFFVLKSVEMVEIWWNTCHTPWLTIYNHMIVIFSSDLWCGLHIPHHTSILGQKRVHKPKNSLFSSSKVWKWSKRDEIQINQHSWRYKTIWHSHSHISHCITLHHTPSHSITLHHTPSHSITLHHTEVQGQEQLFPLPKSDQMVKNVMKYTSISPVGHRKSRVSHVHTHITLHHTASHCTNQRGIQRAKKSIFPS